MDRRNFLKKGILFSGSLFGTDLFAKNHKEKFHFIMPPKPFEYYIKEGKEKGGRILIIGGIHGNEEGGYKASDILIDTQIKKGVVAILPRSNPESIFTYMRGYNGDMNRKFSNLSRRDSDYYKVNSIKNFIADFKPDVILSLHDGYGFYRKNKAHWGECLVIDEDIYKNIPLLQIASTVSKYLKSHNLNIPVHNTNTFSKQTKHKEQRRSLTYYSLQHHNTPAFCIEASKQTDLKRKVQIHLLAIQKFFDIYNVEIEPTFGYLLSNLDKLIKYEKTKIIAHINNHKVLIQSDKKIVVPKGSEVKFEVLNNRGGGIIPRGVNVNYKSFFYRNSLAFDIKNDNLKEYTLIIKKGRG